MNSENNGSLFFPARPALRENIVWIASIALIYFIAAQLSLLLEFQPEDIAALWPPSGIFLSAILLTRRDLRPWLVGTLFLTDFMAECLAGTPFLVSALYSLSLAGNAVLSAWLLHRFVGEPVTFRRVRDVAGWLALSVLLSNALTSLLAAAAAGLLPASRSFWSAWHWSATPDGVGNLLVTPFILGWADWARTRSRVRNRQRVFEGAALFLSLALVNFALFHYLSGDKLFALFLPYVSFPFLLWAALRFGTRGVATALLILAAITVPFAAAGRIPSFSFGPGVLNDVIVAQLFLAVMAVPSLFLAAVVAERHQAEAARLAGAQRHAVTLKSIGDAVIATDTRGRVELVNPVAETLTGWTHEDARGQPLKEVFRIINEDTRQPVEGPVERILREGLVVGLANHTVLVAKNGAERPIADSGAPIRDEQNEIIGVVLVFRDQTEERAAQEKVRTSEVRYRRLFESAKDGILILDAETGVIVDVNPFLLELLGYSGQAFPGKKVWELGFLKGLVANAADFAELRQKGYIRYEDKPLETADGRRIEVEFVSNSYLVNQRKVIQCSLRDITERKRAEKTLRDSEELYSSLVENLPQHVFRKDRDGRFLFCNQRFCESVGHSLPEIVGKTDADFFPPQLAKTYRQDDLRVMESGRALEQIEEHLTGDGRKLFVQVVKTPLRDASGAVVGIQGIFWDITERKQAEANQQLVVDALRLLNRPNDLTALVGELVRLIKCATGFEAVGLRLRQGDDFPYYVTAGFAEHFVQAERYLCARDQAGELVRDSKGNPVLECRCGDVLCGRTHRALPFFTEGGSFWTNSTTRLLATTTEADRQARMRNCCKGEGYESVALIPLRSGEEIIGLLQLNDRRPGRFTPELIRFYEGLAASIGVALKRGHGDEALRESEDRYRGLFEGSYDAFLTLEPPAWRFTSGNPAAVKMFGAENEKKVVSHWPWELSPDRQPDGRASAEKAKEMLETAMREGSHFFEWTHRRISGEEFPATVLLSRMQSAGRVFLQTTIRDITEHKRAEEQLRKQAALLDAATDAIYVRALDHTVTYWNAGAERLYGWPRAEALGRKVTDLGDMDHAAFEAAQAVLLAQGAWSGELRKTSKAGKEEVVFCRWTLLRDEQGRPKEVLAINTDITERKQLEGQFLRAQRMEGIGALAGGIAHDLNNILAPILMVGPLLRETVGDPESRRMIDTVENCAQRGADIIKQLLTFARGKPGARAPLPARHLLNEMHKFIRETFPRNIQPLVNVPKDLWLILGDATQIHQALMNLCVNARDAMPEGGALTLAAENVTLDRARAARTHNAKAGEYVRLSVTDTGTGIPPEHVDRIFDPFFTTKELGKGTGLGLATVLGIVRGHGGFVRVNSQMGQGTTFELYLPASPEVKAARVPDHKAAPPRGQGELILVVDDEAAVRQIVRQTLENYGYRVIAAGEGAEALALFGQHRAEVRAVIADMMMPGMDGPKLVRALRQLGAQLPLLGMTGLADRVSAKGLEALNLPVLLNKPFAAEDLLTALHEALASSRPAPEAGPDEKPRPQ